MSCHRPLPAGSDRGLGNSARPFLRRTCPTWTPAWLLADEPTPDAAGLHGSRLLPRRVRRSGTDHEVRRAFGTLRRGTRARRKAKQRPHDSGQRRRTPDTVCTRVLNAITSHRSTVSSTGRARRHVRPLRLRPQNGINGTTTVRRTITATNTAVNARSMETDPNRAGFSTRRTGPITGSVMPWVIRRAW
ncbi:MAG: hypothetical protein JWR13_2629 [Mycobacterium sp.]|nr:hypothetical protein [Mycobacterium sp.]